MKIVISKPKKVFLFILSILAIIIISAILAYLTDKEVRQNEFTIGSIDITLEEALWDALPDIDNSGIPDAAEAMGPGDKIAKDPKVINEGDNPAYVYLRVEVPKAIVKIGEDATAKKQEIFEYTVNDTNWVIMPNLTIGKDDPNADSVIYTYYYQNTGGTEDYLRAGAISQTLFDEVMLKNIVDFNEMNLTQQIVVKAYAIQMGDELTVNANPWISKFEEEKDPIPVMLGLRNLSNPANAALGLQPGEDLVVGVEYDGEVSVTQAPAMTGQIEDGEEFTVPYDGAETASVEKNINLAVSSRANGQVKTILKYKHTIQDGEVGEFKIKSFTGGELYTAKGKRIKVNTVPTISEEEKVLISEPAIVKETIYDKITSADYGKAIIEELPDYVLFYKGEVRNSECTDSETGTNKIALIYNGKNGTSGLTGYYPNNKIPTGASMTTINSGTQKTYSAWWTTSNLSGSGNKNVQAVEKLNDSTWTDAIVPEGIDTSKVTAAGGVGVSTWIKSWNEKNSTKIYKKYYPSSGNNVAGWCVKTGVSGDSSVPNNSYNVSSLTTTNNQLYFPYTTAQNDPNSSNTCDGYWLASPSGYDATSLMFVGRFGIVSRGDVTSTNLAARPVVYLTSDIQGIKDKNETKWSIK